MHIEHGGQKISIDPGYQARWPPPKHLKISKSSKLKNLYPNSASSQCIIHNLLRNFIDRNWNNFQKFNIGLVNHKDCIFAFILF